MAEFSIRVVMNAPQCSLVLSGDVDLQVADALAGVAHSQLAETGVQRLLVDLGAVTFIDSTGLGALVAIRNAANEHGKELVLGNIPERVRQLLGITGLDGAFATSSSDAPTDPQLRIVPG